jgi:hypothetical protein
MTREMFAENFSLSQFTVRSWENGVKPFKGESVQRVVNALNRNGFNCTYEWFMEGKGLSPILINERFSSEDIGFDIPQEKILKEVELFKQCNTSVDVIVATDNCFYPVADIGDYVGLLPLSSKRLATRVGSLVFASYQSHSEDTRIAGRLIKEGENYFIQALLGGDLQRLTRPEDWMFFLFVWVRKNYTE